MAWYWTDDIARALIERGAVPKSRVQEWLRQPHAIAAPDATDIVVLGQDLLGIQSEPQVGAA